MANNPKKPISNPEIEDIELDVLLEAVYRHYGYDFRQYARGSLKRRILNVISSESVKTISGLQERVLHDPEAMRRFILAATVNVTAMFRDPGFFFELREKVIPVLETYPFVRIWVAGCSTGEEMYSLAVVLEEEGVYDRCRIYGTDINSSALQKAKEGLFSLCGMKEYTTNYISAGGKGCFSDYYTAAYGKAVFHEALRRNLVFGEHNLVTDSVFNEFHLILCRNVLIYFNSELRRRVHDLLYDSLVIFGMLCLGSRETIQFTAHETDYEAMDSEEKIYRKTR